MGQLAVRAPISRVEYRHQRSGVPAGAENLCQQGRVEMVFATYRVGTARSLQCYRRDRRNSWPTASRRVCLLISAN